jgi:hypothetical protein
MTEQSPRPVRIMKEDFLVLKKSLFCRKEAMSEVRKKLG